MQPAQIAMLVGASLLAGAVNAVAGGGTLLSFPAAMAVGLSPLAANATNTVALFPGQLASAWGYRRELGRDRAVVRMLWPAAALGGLSGSLLLLLTPQRLFDAIVPVLVLLATALLFVQNLRRSPAARPSGASAAPPAAPSTVAPAAPPVAPLDEPWHLPKRRWAAQLAQFLAAIYGGYFGAGMGIMLLALYTRMGARDLNRMNGVKTVLSALVNSVACIAFVAARAIDPVVGGIMAAAAIVGGLLGALGARRVPPAIVRWAVVAIGFCLSVVLGYQRLARLGH